MSSDRGARSVTNMATLVPPLVVVDVRKRGYVPRLARGLFPFARQHGLRELLITCDVGHESQRESILSLGATELDELPAVGTDPAKQRFVLAIADGA